MAQLTVEEASATYVRAMRNVAPAGVGVCRICRTFIDPDFSTCYPCGHQPERLDVVVPISYSEHLGQLHLALRNYKDGVRQVQNYAMPRIAGILWRFLKAHEACVAAAGGAPGFDLVTVVPSTTPEKDEARSNLRTIVGWCAPVSDRFERLLRPTGEVAGRAYDERRYVGRDDLEGEHVLLIDDTWTSGGHAQSAAHALKEAGAGQVALVVVGRHLQRSWQVTEDETSGDHFDALPRIFDWDTCAVHDSQESG